MRVFWVCSILVFFSTGLFGQEQIGLTTGNYTGIAGVFQNPANPTSSRQNWDVMLGGGFAFLENNYLFLEGTSLLDLYRNRSSLDVALATDVEGSSGPGVRIADFRDDGEIRYLTALHGVIGPGFLFSIEGGHSFGLSSRLRVFAGGQNIPNILSYYRYDRQPDRVPFPIEPFSMGILGVGEVALHYSYQLPTYFGEAGFGISLKSLHGLEAAYFENEQVIDYTKIGSDTASSNLADFRFALSNGWLTPETYALQRSGSGWGVDVGVVFTGDEGYNEFYQWKVGVSLLDIGAVTFRENSAYHEVSAPTTVSIYTDGYEFAEDLGDVENLIQVFSAQTLGDSLASFQTSSFTYWMPAALSVQGEYAFTDFAFLHGLWVQRIPTRGIGMDRGNLLAVTPRLEWRWWAVGLPLSLYNYREVQVGAFVRLGPLTIGTENLGAWAGQRTFTGYDAYLSLRVPFFTLGGGDGPRTRSGRRGKGRVKCYEF
jgi:hypothetical protein